jgi:hypothetical protein
MNKKGLEFKKALFALIIIGMAIYGIGIWVGEWSDKYSSGINYDLGNYNQLDTLSSYVTSTQGNLSTKSSFDTTSAGDFEGTSIRGAFSIVNDIFTPFNVLFGDGGMLSSIQNRWNIPNYIMIGIISMMILAIVFALIALFFRQPGGST